MQKKVIFFELNEVPWRVVEDFVRDYPDSSIARLLPKMTKFRTFAEDRNLNPWVTWPTVHRGVPDRVHAISDFGQDLREVDEEYPAVWDLLVRNGISTGIFGSFHTYPLPTSISNYKFYVPDVFAAGSECFPKKFSAFQEFNLAMSRASGRSVQTGMPLGPTAKLLWSLPSLGLKPRTAMDLAGQLVDERLEHWKRTRRRTYQVVLAFDLFMKAVSKEKPQFATFFTNHVASSMHRYWAARYPQDYKKFGYSDEWKSRYSHEIEWTMGKFDEMLGRLAAFVSANPDYALWILSSMGQAATTADNETMAQVYLTDLEKFMAKFGFAPNEFERRPTMLPRLTVRIPEERVVEFENATSAITVGGRSRVKCEHLGHGVFAIKPPIIRDRSIDFCTLDGEQLPLRVLGFEFVEIDDQSGQTAYHIPEGMMLTWDPSNPATDGVVRDMATIDVAPMILDNFGIRRPDYMRSDRR